MTITSEAINEIFNEHEEFILIGLTGRTGSGCSTVAEILESKDFKNLHMQTPKNHDFNFNYERKERIIYNYACKHWDNGFKRISMTDIITSFLFQQGYEEIIKFIENFDNGEKIFPDKKDFIAIIQKNKSTIDSTAKKIKKIFYEEKSKEDIEKTFDKVKTVGGALKQKLESSIIKVGVGTDEEYTASAYTYLYQTFGNNIRGSGNPFNDEFSGTHIFDIAKRANAYIKIIRESFKQHTRIVLDAIRNPYEAQFFRNRYSAFYLMSVNTDEEERIRRLANINNNKQIKSIDEIEYLKKLKGSEKFSNQDIAACIQLADIHINNPRCDNEKHFLVKQIVKFVMLMKHPGLVTPTHVERCMQLAYTAKLNSGCISRQVGAVITGEDFSVKAVGWNDVPKGQVPCLLRDIDSFCKEKDESSHSKFELSNSQFADQMNEANNKIPVEDLNGRLHPYCFKDIYNAINGNKNQVHTRALHAEENAFLQLAKYSSGGIKNGYLFSSASPCELCSKKAYQLGIKKIYYIDPYPGISESHILSFGKGESDPEMNLFYGAIGRAYINLYVQNMPIKDELESLVGDLWDKKSDAYNKIESPTSK